MSTRRWCFGALLLLLPLAGVAEASDCPEAFAECKDDCSLQYGSVRVEMKRRLAECVQRCEREAVRCTDESKDERAHALGEGTLDSGRRGAASDGGTVQASPFRGAPKESKGGHPRDHDDHDP